MADTGVKCSFFIFIAFGLSYFCPATSLRHHIAPCEVVTPCVCEFPTGEAVDISVLSNQTFRTNMTDNVTVLFQPCHKITVQNVSTCNESSLCLFNMSSNISTPLGNVDELKFQSENTVKPVALQFVHSHLTSTIDLTCSESGNGTSFTGNKINENEFHFTLKSPAACVHLMQDHSSRSLLSVFFISALIVGIAYFVAMIIVRHSRGAIGWEVLPHHDTCMRLPSLCQAGCNGLLSCCRLQPSYEQI